MKTQHLTPKSVGVLRRLLMDHPEPVHKRHLNGYVIPRLQRNDPEIIRECAAPRVTNKASWPDTEPAYCLTAYGLEVARSIPADVPDEPDGPITVDITNGTASDVDTTPIRTGDKQFTNGTSYHKSRSSGQPPLASGRPSDPPRHTLLKKKKNHENGNGANPTPTTVPDAPREDPLPAADTTATDAPCPDDCPEIRHELRLVYDLFPQIRDAIRAVMSTQSKLNS